MFERFTDRARKVLALAQVESLRLNHDFIGTEHILLGLIAEGDGVAAQALESLGIPLEAVREKVQEKVEETIGPAGSSTTGSPPFTPRAKKVLELSLREALQLGHNYIGTEHMLLGLVREGEGVAAQVLVSLGADLSGVRQQVMQLPSGYAGEEGDAGSGPPGGEERSSWGFPVRRTAPERATNPDRPLCQNCLADLVVHARARTLSAPDDEGGPAVVTTMVYCGACGRSLAGRIESPPPPGAG